MDFKYIERESVEPGSGQKSTAETMIEAQLGAPTQVLCENDSIIMFYSLDQIKQYIARAGWTLVRKPFTYVQSQQQTRPGTLPTLEGQVEMLGGLLCCSFDPDRPGVVVHPFVQGQGEAALAPAAGLYRPLEDPPDVMHPTSICGAEGATDAVVEALLTQPYVRRVPTYRECIDAEWTSMCSAALQVRLDYSWCPTASEPSHLMRVPGTDDIYFVTRERFEADRWAPLVDPESSDFSDKIDE